MANKSSYESFNRIISPIFNNPDDKKSQSSSCIERSNNCGGLVNNFRSQSLEDLFHEFSSQVSGKDENITTDISKDCNHFTATTRTQFLQQANHSQLFGESKHNFSAQLETESKTNSELDTLLAPLFGSDLSESAKRKKDESSSFYNFFRNSFGIEPAPKKQKSPNVTIAPTDTSEISTPPSADPFDNLDMNGIWEIYSEILSKNEQNTSESDAGASATEITEIELNSSSTEPTLLNNSCENPPNFVNNITMSEFSFQHYPQDVYNHTAIKYKTDDGFSNEIQQASLQYYQNQQEVSFAPPTPSYFDHVLLSPRENVDFSAKIEYSVESSTETNSSVDFKSENISISNNKSVKPAPEPNAEHLQPKSTYEFINILTILNGTNTCETGKRIFYNISNIGTEEWLETARNILGLYSKHKNRAQNISISDPDKMYNAICKQVTVYSKDDNDIYIVEKQRPRLIQHNYSFEDIVDHLTTDSFDPIYEQSQVTPKKIPRSYVLQTTRSEYEICADKNAIIENIREIFAKVCDSFVANKYPAFHMPLQRRKNCCFANHRLSLKPIDKRFMATVSFGRVISRFRFCLMLYILAKVKDLLETNSKITQREFFYQCKKFIRHQHRFRNLLHTVYALLNVGPWDLNIISLGGLIFGNLIITLTSGQTINCNDGSTLMTTDPDDIVEVATSAQFILIVEKEAIFRKLIDENLQSQIGKPCILVTGKGYPDVYTRYFMRKLCSIVRLPTFILTDADVYGIKIAMTYKYGSIELAHVSQYLALPEAKWLGVYPSEIVTFGMEHAPVNKRDLQIVCDVKQLVPQVIPDVLISNELDVLKDKKIKASIEGLIKNSSFLSGTYLKNKLKMY